MLERGVTVDIMGDVDFDSPGQTGAGGLGGGGDADGALMTAGWSAWRDAVCWGAVAAYAVNRWIVEPRVVSAFFDGHFNDLLLIPAALPWVIQAQSWLGWRPEWLPPRPGETIFHLVVWAMVCEVVGPRWLGRGTPDGWDVACYAAGAVLAQWWWCRRWRAEAGGIPEGRQA